MRTTCLAHPILFHLVILILLGALYIVYQVSLQKQHTESPKNTEEFNEHWKLLHLVKKKPGWKLQGKLQRMSQFLNNDGIRTE
jgi:hypothetical protein